MLTVLRIDDLVNGGLHSGAIPPWMSDMVEGSGADKQKGTGCDLVAACITTHTTCAAATFVTPHRTSR